jgi:hypothetical protein
MKVDEFFLGPPAAPSHPRLRNWKARLEQGATATVEVFWPGSALGPSEAEMNIQFVNNAQLLPLETIPWDDDLNAGLIQLKVRAPSPEGEAERFALGLRAAMRKAVREFGDGYFNSVLVDFLRRDTDFSDYPAVAEVLKHAHAIAPYCEGAALDRYRACRDMIRDAISRRASELTQELGYTHEQAVPILVGALARYLDERFSISSRRRFGLL